MNDYAMVTVKDHFTMFIITGTPHLLIQYNLTRAIRNAELLTS